MDLFDSKNKVIIRNNNNISIIDNSIDINNSYSMPSTTTTANESFANIGGLTQTTATLTPTTLKNIEEQFMEIIPPQPRPHPQEARFVPPLVNISANYASLQISTQNDFNNNSSNNSNSNTSDLEYGSDYDSDDSSSQSRSSAQWNAFCDKDNSSVNNKTNNLSDNNSNSYNRSAKPKTRGTCGRKPLRNEKLTPEEEKKRQQRRERNKQAAARCRKRRMDHTNQLLMETEGLEDKKHSLLNEIETLRKQKEELEYILEAHNCNKRVGVNKAQHIDIKPVVSNGSVITKSRPNSLPLPCIYDSMSDTGIPIQTPSAGLFLDNIEGGTGLTPILNATLTPSIVTPTVISNICGVRLKSTPLLESPTKKLVPL